MTQDIKYTPAPWETGEASWNDDGEVRYTLHGNKEAKAADAYLIAASPDMAAAIECSIALDYAHQDALKILEKHGYDHSNRFELNATDFVHGLKVAALKKAKGQS